MPEREPLSVAVITLNEERNLERCLRSVDWAEEIVVVDSGSTDLTRQIAERHGATFLSEPWQGFVAMKNLALDRTRHDWVLSIDADEWLTEAGAEEMRQALCAPEADAFEINRLPAFCGAFLRAVWGPDRVVRLVRKDRGRWGGGRVHESIRMVPGSRVHRLRQRMPHLTYRNLRDYVARMNCYTELSAESMAERGRKVSVTWMLLSPPATFLRQFLLKGGFRDGIRGLIACAGTSFYVLLKYAKLWERSRDCDPDLVKEAGSTPEDPDPAAFEADR